MEIKYKIIDNMLGVWFLDRGRLYLEEAEKEFVENGVPVEQNGYGGVETLEDALKILVGDGCLDLPYTKTMLVQALWW